MMPSVLITKDKIKVRGYNEKIVNAKVSDLPLYLRFDIELGDDVTFERIFNIVMENEKMFDIIFASSLGGFAINEYFDEFLLEPNNDDTDILYLEIGHATDVWTYEGKKEISHYIDFHGIGKDTTYSICFTSLNNLKSLPIKINNEIAYHNFSYKLKKYRTQMKGIQPISVFDFFDAILHEISWHGSPKQRDAQRQELVDQIDKINSGEIETYEMKNDDDGAYIMKNGKKEYLFKNDK